MKDPKLGDLIYWENKLAKIVAIQEATSVVIEMIEPMQCPHCGGVLEKKHFSAIPTSPWFQENAKPVQTMGEYPGELIKEL